MIPKHVNHVGDYEVGTPEVEGIRIDKYNMGNSQIKFNGNVTGTAKLQTSNDNVEKAENATVWDDIPNTSQNLTNNFQHTWHLGADVMGAKFIKHVVDIDSGDGTFTINSCFKVS